MDCCSISNMSRTNLECNEHTTFLKLFDQVIWRPWYKSCNFAFKLIEVPHELEYPTIHCEHGNKYKINYIVPISDSKQIKIIQGHSGNNLVTIITIETSSNNMYFLWTFATWLIIPTLINIDLNSFSKHNIITNLNIY